MGHGAVECRFEGSSIDDSVAALVAALLLVLGQDGDRTVEWPLEPGVMLMRFSRRGDVATVECGEVCFSGAVRDVVRPFWKALRDLQGRQSAAGYLREWHRPFPADGVRMIGDFVRGRGA